MISYFDIIKKNLGNQNTVKVLFHELGEPKTWFSEHVSLGTWYCLQCTLPLAEPKWQLRQEKLTSEQP